MSDGRIEGSAGGELRLAGVLDYQSGPALRRQGQALIRQAKGTRISADCRAVERSSSVGLSLLLAFTRDAQKQGDELVVTGLPEDMRELARVSGLLDVLSLASETEGAV
ncbi:STAS domain-containing protein [Stutzerimonas xanthomarina]|uniref:STAS domain-containing protein n=1 Tax=Stutzerimonas xanthomarina TaxID=271420 RepID=UPI003AA83773